MEQKQEYVIGLDGGGTKTSAVVADRHGTVVAESLGGPSNFQTIGVEKAAGVLLSLIEDCCQKAGCRHGDVLSIVAGLTGAGRRSDQERMENGFKSFAEARGVAFKSFHVESDARIALEGAFRGKPGVILIAGTGSIAFGKDAKGKVHRVGGWGRIIGDEGSGYAIGREGLNAVARDIDGRGKRTLLTRLLRDELNLGDEERIIAAVYREHFDIASIAPLVMKAARRGDAICQGIVRNAVHELCGHVPAILRRMRVSAREKTRVALGGTLASGILSKPIKRELEARVRRVKVVAPESSPAEGAVFMALALLGGSGDQ